MGGREREIVDKDLNISPYVQAAVAFIMFLIPHHDTFAIVFCHCPGLVSAAVAVL